MNNNPWQRVKDTPPAENVVVETVIDDATGRRNEALLKRNRGLWYLPDDSVYVYYTPTHWRQVMPSEANAI